MPFFDLCMIVNNNLAEAKTRRTSQKKKRYANQEKQTQISNVKHKPNLIPDEGSQTGNQTL